MGIEFDTNKLKAYVESLADMVINERCCSKKEVDESRDELVKALAFIDEIINKNDSLVRSAKSAVTLYEKSGRVDSETMYNLFLLSNK